MKDGSHLLNTSSSSEEAKDDVIKAVPSEVKASTPLHAVQSHFLEALKKRIVTAFWR